MKSKVDELDFDQLVPVPVDLSKLSDVVKNDAVKKDVYNPEKKNVEDKITDFINLVIKTTFNAKSFCSKSYFIFLFEAAFCEF